MIGKKQKKLLCCSECGYEFSDIDAERTCSNCFACTGCEIYICPSCRNEVVVKPIKKMQ